MQSGELQYLENLQKIYKDGYDIVNERTGQICRTIINADMEFDASTNHIPLVTTRKAGIKHSIAELLAYIRGYTSAEQFRSLGTKTWDANANENKTWLANRYRKGKDDLGMIYGAVAKNWPVFIKHDDDKYYMVGKMDLFHKVYNNLKNGKDDRGETITFWNPGMFDLGCLRPCMRTHTFSILGDNLYLTSEQRSSDFPLGTVANMVQTVVFLRLMAQITGLKPAKVFHKNINCHIYGNQLEFVPEQLSRIPYNPPELKINPDIKTLEDLETWVTVDDFVLENYQHHPEIKYPFSV